MKKIFAFTLSIILIVFISMNESAAQPNEDSVVISKGISSDSKQSDENIIVPKGNNKGDKKKDMPVSRSADNIDQLCTVVTQNKTPWQIDIYIGGEYKGTVAPNENRVAWTINGDTRIYAKSPKAKKAWGPLLFYCKKDYVWVLEE